MKSLYNKFSNDRRKEYAIRTEILRDGDERYVRKYNLFPEGEQYMDYMVQIYSALVNRFAQLNRIEVLPCKRIDNGVEFPFIKGKTLHQVLLEAIKNGDKQELFRLLDDYLSVVIYQREACAFEQTEKFKEVFGVSSENFIGEAAIAVADIDMIPSNIIINEDNGKWTIIDYEWTFLCPVPVKYLKFRSLLFWCNECKGNTLVSWHELMEHIEISPEEESQFRTWENHFQTYIIDGKVPFYEINHQVPTNHIDLSTIEAKIDKGLEILVDKGNGYEEINSVYEVQDEFIMGKIDVSSDVKHIKISVNSLIGFCHVKSIIDQNNQPIDFRENGIEVLGRLSMMNQEDFVIECDVDGVQSMKYEIYLNRLPKTSEAKNLINTLLLEKSVKEKEYRDAYFVGQRRIQDLTCQVENLTRELEEIKAGRWYRLGQKLKR